MPSASVSTELDKDNPSPPALLPSRERGTGVRSSSAAKALLASEQLFRVCADAMTEGLLVRDAFGGVRFCNRSAEQILGTTSDDLRRGKTPDPFETAIGEDGELVDAGRNPMTLSLQSGAPVDGVVLGVRRPDGELRWIEVNAKPLIDGPSRRRAPLATVATFADITTRKESERRASEQIEQIRCLNAIMRLQMGELEKANAQLGLLAAHDSLTGLKNHRSFHERLSAEVERSIRKRTSLSVILLDVDHFKLYNDTFGHPAGDGVLRQLAQILGENARAGDIVAPRPLGRRRVGEYTIARHGGEEFSLILPGADIDAAMKVAERLRVAIEWAEWSHRQVTASFGVSTLSAEVADPTALIAAADKALYLSKSRGRNRVTQAA